MVSVAKNSKEYYYFTLTGKNSTAFVSVGGNYY